jgi:hypothetical protein
VRHAWLWLVPLSFLLGAALFEGVLRAIPSLLPPDAEQRLLFMKGQRATKSVGDPYLGFLYPPRSQLQVRSPDFDILIQTDEHGFRNPSPWPDQAEVVIVGDSMAFGYGVSWEQAWPALLDAALPTSRVITLGMPGTVPQQYMRFFERFGLPLRPRFLVYTVFAGNDIREAPVFDQWLAAGSPGNYDLWRMFQGQPPTPGQALLRHSYLVLAMDSLRKSLGNFRAEYRAQSVELADGGRLRLAPYEFARTAGSNSPGMAGFDSVVRATVEARDLAEGIGCDFVVAFVPMKERVYSQLLGKLREPLSAPLKKVLEREYGINVIDLGEAMIEQAARGRTLYFEVDGHPNAAGNRIIADAIAHYLRGRDRRSRP